ncbi:MAG: hypothetical protein WC511_02265 [Candidatus Pacearchaeota archaeon]
MPSGIILIEVVDLYTWEPLSKNSRAQTLLRELDSNRVREVTEGFALYLLNFLKSLVLNAIKMQKFPVRYAPLSPAYARRKLRKGWRHGFWQMTGFLQNHIEIWKIQTNNYAIGFKHGIIHPETGAPIEDIVKWLEKGVPSHNQPARPLFYPLSAGISKHVYDVHFRRYIRDKHSDLVDLLDPYK